MIIPVTELRGGDVITTDSDDITVESIEQTDVGGVGPCIRIYGRITRGWGASRKVLRWVHRLDHQVSVFRPGAGEAVWQTDAEGVMRRVR